MENKSRKYWDKVFSNSVSGCNTESWLENLQKYYSLPGSSDVLDLGCGSGTDSGYLSGKGFNVFSADLSLSALSSQLNNNSTFNAVQLNLSNPFPFKDSFFLLVNASLSLHYFDLNKTRMIISEIERILKPGGVFTGRFNSINDKNLILLDQDKISDNFYNVEGIPRFYFNAGLLQSLFSNWKINHLEEKEIDYFGSKKTLLEIVAEKR